MIPGYITAVFRFVTHSRSRGGTLQDAAMRPFSFRTSEKSGHAVHVAPESRMSLGLQKVRHQSCGKLDALSILRNCIDCFERPTCQMHGSSQMRFSSGHDRRHLIDTARLLVDILAYPGSVALRWESHDARVFVCGMIVCTTSTDQGHSCGATWCISTREVWSNLIKSSIQSTLHGLTDCAFTQLRLHHITLPQHDVLDLNRLSFAADAGCPCTPAGRATGFVHTLQATSMASVCTSNL
jgi:hypothetical protein